MINSIVKYIAFCGISLLLFFGCKKSNHDTLVLLGEESYMKTIDEIYPLEYRLQWPTIDQSGYYSVSGDVLQPPLNEGVFPPNLMGEFLIEGVRTGGNELYHNGYTDVPLYSVTQVDEMNISLKILEQRNGLAKISINEYNDHGENTINTDEVFLYGNGATGEFTLFFDATLPMNNVLTEYYAFIVSGVFTYHIDQSDTIYGMSDVRCWHLVKEKQGTSPIYVNVGGQRVYKDKDDFAIRVKTVEELEEENQR